MPKARAFDEEDTKPIALGELCLVALPIETFRALSNEAAARGITFAQLMQQAVGGALEKPQESTGLRGPSLLTEKI